MGSKSRAPLHVLKTDDDGKAGVFALKMGLLCSTAAGQARNMSDRSCLLTSSNLSLPSLSPSCPPLSCLFLHPSFPNIFLFLSSPPPLSFPSTSFFSLYFSRCLFSMSFYPWICFSSLFFFSSVFLPVFFILPRAPSISFPLSQPQVTGPFGLSTRVGQKKEGQGFF